MLPKLARDEVIMALHMRLGFSARGGSRAAQKKIGQWGASSPKDFFRSECNSNKQTECILVSWIEVSRLSDCPDWFHKYGSNAFWFAKKSNF